MPQPERETAATVVPGSAADLPEPRRRALAVLLQPGLAHVVDLVAWREGDELHTAAAGGHVVRSLALPAKRSTSRRARPGSCAAGTGR